MVTRRTKKERTGQALNSYHTHSKSTQNILHTVKEMRKKTAKHTYVAASKVWSVLRSLYILVPPEERKTMRDRVWLYLNFPTEILQYLATLRNISQCKSKKCSVIQQLLKMQLKSPQVLCFLTSNSSFQISSELNNFRILFPILMGLFFCCFAAPSFNKTLISYFVHQKSIHEQTLESSLILCIMMVYCFQRNNSKHTMFTLFTVIQHQSTVKNKQGFYREYFGKASLSQLLVVDHWPGTCVNG